MTNNTINNVPRDFKKRPVIIQAIKWTGDNLFDVIKFMSGAPSIGTCIGAAKWKEYCDLVQDSGLIIKTLEGQHIATVGDMIIRGVKGEFYPCKPDIFDMTYELSAPSPAGVDGLEVETYLHTMHMELGQTEQFCSKWKGDPFGVSGVDYSSTYSVTSEPLCRLSDAKAIIDGLRARCFSLVMNCAAELETASYCMTDEEAKRIAQSGADYYRKEARLSAGKEGSDG